MAQNITLLGASYSDVPAVTLPKTGGGTATFTDTTIASNAASASDILAGKLAYVNGTLITGTGSGGGGTGGITQDQDGYLVLSDQGGGGGGGGLEFEEGTYEPTTDIARPTINYTGAHTDVPIYVTFCDVSDPSTLTASSSISFTYVDTYKMFGTGFPYSTTAMRYGYYSTVYYSSAGTISSYMYFYNSDTQGSTSGYPSYWVTNTGFNPYTNSDTRYWRAGRTYKWIAVWKPTT